MKYPIFIPSMLGWILPGLAAIAAAIVIAIWGEAETIGIVIGVVSPIGIAAICLTGVLAQLIARKTLVDTSDIVDYSTGNNPKLIFYQINRTIKDRLGALNTINLLQGQSQLVDNIEDCLSYHTRLRLKDIWKQPIIVTLMKAGTIKKTFWDGVVRRCRGLQKGRLIKIEYRDVDMWKQALALLRHELAHVMLTLGTSVQSEEAQHAIMKKAGIP